MSMEESIRKYMTGELTSDEHLKVGDMIRENSDWRLYWQNLQRAQQKINTDFVGTSSDRKPVTDNAPRDTIGGKPIAQSQPESWFKKYLTGWPLFILIFLIARFGSCAIREFKGLREKIMPKTEQGSSETKTIEGLILKDLTKRYGNPADSMTSVIATCASELESAQSLLDQGQKGDYVAALISVSDNETSPCKDEALYLAAKELVAQEEHDMAMQCIVKIEDLDHFNADSQFLIAKIFIAKAKSGDISEQKAQRAIDRALAFPENEQYKSELIIDKSL
jgi:hypothetical protein